MAHEDSLYKQEMYINNEMDKDQNELGLLSDVHTVENEEIELPILSYTTQDNSFHTEIIQSSQDKLQCEFSLVKPVRLTDTTNDGNTTRLTTRAVLLSPQQKNTVASRQKTEKTPKNILRMMERHRENERVRHHTLNKSLKIVCSKVPGLSVYLKETKVVMMQRIISYICFMENTICNLCDNLSIKVPQLKIPTNLLTDQWKESSAKSKNSSIISCFKPCNKASVQIRPKSRFRYQKLQKCSETSSTENCRLKVSSPTVDSTTDSLAMPIKVEQTNFESTQESTTSSSSLSPLFKPHGIEMDVFMDCNACSVPNGMEDTPGYFNEEFLPSSNSFDNFPDAFDLVSSPLGGAVRSRYVLLSPKVKAMDNVNISEFGIKSDDGDLLDTGEVVNSHEMRTISPECVLPTTPLLCAPISCLVGKIDHTPLHSSSTWQLESHSNEAVMWQSAHGKVEQLLRTPDKKTLLKNKNKRKQYTPKRSPFSNITNFEGRISREPSIKKMKTSLPLSTGRIIKPSALDEDFVSYVPYIWKFHNTAITRRQKAEVARQEAKASSPSINMGNDLQSSKPGKIDHRKTTWMNGFMMFSRLNRRQFIEANPGVHTSHISKMMGHAWRNMTPQEQQPYKEKARDYAKCMKLDVGLEAESSSTDDKVTEGSTVDSVSSSGLENIEEDSVDAVLHDHMVPFKITSSSS